MSLSDGLEALDRAFSGHGIDEKSIISILGNSHADQRQSFRKRSDFFVDDERRFEKWDDHHVKILKHEFMRFKNAVVMSAMHPWERDARLVKEALQKGSESYNMIVEIACTRSSNELLGARKAYHSLFDQSIEEDVASHINGKEKKLLVALVSAYRYEGPKVKEDHAKSEAKTLAAAVKNAAKQNPLENDEVIRILSTRSKPHLKSVYKYYKDISGVHFDEELDVDLILQAAVECLCTPHTYFTKVLDAALKHDAHKHTKKALTRVVVARADTDIKEITAEYQKIYGVPLTQKIEETVNGSYKEFLLTLIAK
ncbi:putative Annexin [Melia azedarach]|uniref:Annexin n=1 Tax=Melia azedarach TaxID=155640 RepID=A0ACC1XKR4_MELAZ|nr:putative Annexin [Melia azedarach]